MFGRVPARWSPPGGNRAARDALNIRWTRFHLLEGQTLATEDPPTKVWLGTQLIDGSYAAINNR